MDKIIIEKLEKYINEHPEDGVWKDELEIETITGVDIHKIIKTLRSNSSNKFVHNRKDKYSTRNMYNKHASLWTKFKDNYLGYFQ